MKNKFTIIIMTLTVITAATAFVLSRINNKEETTIDNIATIREVYATLSNNVNDNIGIRKRLLDKLNVFDTTNYENEHNEYTELLDEYNTNIISIDENVQIMDSKCAQEYEDTTINIFCRGYSDLYEEVINIYVDVISNYNKKIKDHNAKNATNYELYNMIHKDYVDINKDGAYRGQQEK